MDTGAAELVDQQRAVSLCKQAALALRRVFVPQPSYAADAKCQLLASGRVTLVASADSKCWTMKSGYIVVEGHLSSVADDLKSTLDDAKTACKAASDCHGVVKATKHGSGSNKFRVAHGATMTLQPDTSSSNNVVYTYSCTLLGRGVRARGGVRNALSHSPSAAPEFAPAFRVNLSREHGKCTISHFFLRFYTVSCKEPKYGAV